MENDVIEFTTRKTFGFKGAESEILTVDNDILNKVMSDVLKVKDGEKYIVHSSCIETYGLWKDGDLSFEKDGQKLPVPVVLRKILTGEFSVEGIEKKNWLPEIIGFNKNEEFCSLWFDRLFVYRITNVGLECRTEGRWEVDDSALWSFLYGEYVKSFKLVLTSEEREELQIIVGDSDALLIGFSLDVEPDDPHRARITIYHVRDFDSNKKLETKLFPFFLYEKYRGLVPGVIYGPEQLWAGTRIWAPLPYYCYPDKKLPVIFR